MMGVLRDQCVLPEAMTVRQLKNRIKSLEDQWNHLKLSCNHKIVFAEIPTAPGSEVVAEATIPNEAYTMATLQASVATMAELEREIGEYKARLPLEVPGWDRMEPYTAPEVIQGDPLSEHDYWHWEASINVANRISSMFESWIVGIFHRGLDTVVMIQLHENHSAQDLTVGLSRSGTGWVPEQEAPFPLAITFYHPVKRLQPVAVSAGYRIWGTSTHRFQGEQVEPAQLFCRWGTCATLHQIPMVRPGDSQTGNVCNEIWDLLEAQRRYTERTQCRPWHLTR